MSWIIGGSTTVQVGTTSVSVPVTSTVVAGDILVITVVNKYPNNGPATPTGWTLAAAAQKSGGSGSSGVDKGTVYATIFTRVSDGTESGNITISVSSGNSLIAKFWRLTPNATGATADLAFVNAAMNTASSSVSITPASFLDVAAGDLIFALFGINTDNYSFSAESFTQSGIGFTTTERLDNGTAQGDDCGNLVCSATVDSGSANSGITFAATASGSATDAPAGALVIMRVRELDTITGTGIAGAEAFGSGSIAAEIDGTGIATGSAFGSASINPEVDGSGIASASAQGTPDIGITVAGAGVTSGEAFGAGSLTDVIGGTGIPGGEAFGSASIFPTISGAGIASGAAFGQGSISPSVNSSGISSGEAFGSGIVSLEIDGHGIPSGEAFGSEESDDEIFGGGIPSGEAFGQPSLLIVLFGAGIDGSQGFIPGPQIGHGAIGVAIAGTGVPGADDFGAAYIVGYEFIQAKSIRDGIKKALLNSTRAGANVFTNRSEAWDHRGANGGEFPAIAIYMLEENCPRFDEAPRKYQREPRFVIELLLDQRPGRAGDDDLDDFCNEVEAALFMDETAGGFACRSWYEETEITLGKEGDRDIFVAQLTFTYRYFTEVDELPSDAPDFAGIDIDWRGPFTRFRVGRSAVGDPLIANLGAAQASNKVDLQ